MKRNSTLIIIAVTLLSNSFAFAQGYGQRDEARQQAEIERGRLPNRPAQPQRPQLQRAPQNNNYQARPEQVQPVRPYHPGYSNNYRRDDRHYGNGPYNYYRYGDRGVGPNYQIRRGGYLPPQYRNRQYVVNDWRGHHLHRPPAGYHWVQVGGDYVLVAISTGIILQLLLSN